MAATTPRKRKFVDFTEDIIVVTVGAEKKPFKLHPSILTSSSKFFKAALSGNWPNNGTFNLPDANPAAFQTYVTYIYTGDLDLISRDTGEAYDDNSDPQASMRFDRLMDLYILADTMVDDKGLRNAVMDELKNVAKSTTRRPGTEHITFAFKHTAETSTLCTWILDEYLFDTCPEWLGESHNELPLLFLHALMIGWAAASRDKSIKYKDPETTNACVYHEHDDEVPPGPNCKLKGKLAGTKTTATVGIPPRPDALVRREDGPDKWPELRWVSRGGGRWAQMTKAEVDEDIRARSLRDRSG